MTKLLLVLLALVSVASALWFPPIQVESGVRHPEFCGRSLLAGGVQEVRFEGCVNQPCKTYPGKTFSWEIDFTSSATYHGSELQVILMGFGPNGLESIEIPKIFNYGILNSGSEYSMTFTVTIPADFPYNEFMLRAEINGMRFRLGPAQEVCTYLTFENHPITSL